MSRVAEAYAALVAAGELKPDPDQQRAAAALDRFATELGNGQGLLKRLFGKQAPRGVYLWGGVGRGKSMLMDLAFDTIDIEPKRRTHFAPFMLDVHQRLRAARATNEADLVIARGQSGVPLHAHVRRLKQTPGGLVFIHGHCEQDGAICYSLSGTLKKIKSRSDTGDEPRR